jgi:hypothetical protein
MAVFNPLTRMVSVRLSEKEYQHLLELCNVHDAHSTSDMARIAVRGFLADSHNHSQRRRGQPAGNLGAKLQHLEEEVRRLTSLLEDKAAAAGAKG